jgi:dual specificity tyrosine-phosphorylation-regulated kinase 2/3/4
MSLSTAKVSNSSTNQIHQTMASPSSSRQSLSTPSPVPSSIDEEELAGDEEMMHYIRRQQAKKMAVGAAQEELDDLLRFPEPLPPVAPSSPSGERILLFQVLPLISIVLSHSQEQSGAISFRI